MARAGISRVRAAIAPAIASFLVACASAASPQSQPHDRGETNDRVGDSIVMDAEEADAVLALQERVARGRRIRTQDWYKVTRTEGYQRLAKREAAIGRPFTEEEFQAKVSAEELVGARDSARDTLNAWRHADLPAIAARIRAWLPADAKIRVVVFPVIKPERNSFVFEPATNPAIFLAVDPTKTREQFENMVAHELHHIGLAGIPRDGKEGPAEVERAASWLGAFGEGIAMLAAAGGPDVHPHATSPRVERDAWDREVTRAGEAIPKIERFIVGILDGRLATDEAAAAEGMEFFGETQGPWYTLGWIQAVAIERALGREALFGVMRRPLELPATYERAAAQLEARGGAKLPHWSAEFLARVAAVSN